MSLRDTAYAALGLRSGAAPAQVDEAYRRLIKIHHPDKSGGNAAKAAEINRAYSLLRQERLARGPHMHRVPVPIRPARPSGRARGKLVFTLVLLAIVVGGWLAMQRDLPNGLNHPIRFRPPPAALAPEELAEDTLQAFDQPLNSTVIDSAIAQAVKFHTLGDWVAAGIYSRDCNSRLQHDRSLAWFDACVAFDEAIVTLGAAAPQGADDYFADNAIAVREVSAARAFSDDSLGADLRLQQIRSQVQLQLVPLMDQAALEKP